MKKSLMIVSFAIMLIVSMSLFVSAGFFGNLFQKIGISGKPIDPQGINPDGGYGSFIPTVPLNCNNACESYEQCYGDSCVPKKCVSETSSCTSKKTLAPFRQSGTPNTDWDIVCSNKCSAIVACRGDFFSVNTCTGGTSVHYAQGEASDVKRVNKYRVNSRLSNYDITCSCSVSGVSYQKEVADTGVTSIPRIPSVPLNCLDSDEGNDVLTKGTCTDATGVFSDVCDRYEGNAIRERICSNNLCVTETWACPSGTTCNQGECVNVKTDSCGDEFCSANEKDVSNPTAYCSQDCGPKYQYYGTCSTCTGQGFTWCSSSNSCVSNTAGCANKIQYSSNCLVAPVPATDPCPDICGADKDTLHILEKVGDAGCQEVKSMKCSEIQGTGTNYVCSQGECVAPSEASQRCNYTLSDLSYIDEGAKKFFSSIQNAECGLNFRVQLLNELPSDYEFNLTDKNIIVILNITSNKQTTASLDLNLNKSELGLRFPAADLGVYVEESKSMWNTVNRQSAEIGENNSKIYNYKIQAPHFSLFLIIEPDYSDYCGNNVLEQDYYEECDGTDNCNSLCECDTDFSANDSGFCLPDLSGKICPEEGNESCLENTLYECNTSLIWEEKGLVSGKCGVECLDGDTSCSGEYPLFCGPGSTWVLQSKTLGICGYGEEPLSYCGDNVCDADENSNSCSEDCGEAPVPPNWLLIALIIILAVLIIVSVFLVIRMIKKRKRQRYMNPNRNLPPEHRPGPKRPPGRPEVVHHGQMGRPPQRRTSQGGYSVRRYPVR